jgi:ArsR family transcriptional regulator
VEFPLHSVIRAWLLQVERSGILVDTNMDSALGRAYQIETVCQNLRLLSVETRLHMLLLLSERNLCVGALACHLGLSQGAISQHLKVLREAGLVIAERAGYYVHYRVDKQVVAHWRHEFDELLEQLRAEPTIEDRELRVSSERCAKRKEELCARRKGEAGVRRGSR